MNITAESYGHATILNLKGEFVEDALAAVRKAVDHTLEGAGVVDVIFNLEEVPFLDSAAMEYLLDLQDRLAERLGQVKLVKAGESVATILEVTRLRSCFEVFADIPEAVKALQP